MEEVKFKIKPGVTPPTFNVDGFEVCVNSVVAIYKGDVKVSDEILKKVQENFDSRGYIKVRKDERLVFGTGVEISTSPDIALSLKELGNNFLEKGIVVQGVADEIGEIKVIMSSTTAFLPRIDKGSEILKVSFYKKNITEVEFSETKDFLS